jgi:hypothetical protein
MAFAMVQMRQRASQTKIKTTNRTMHGTEIGWKLRLVIALIVFSLMSVFVIVFHLAGHF